MEPGEKSSEEKIKLLEDWKTILFNRISEFELEMEAAKEERNRWEASLSKKISKYSKKILKLQKSTDNAKSQIHKINFNIQKIKINEIEKTS